MMKGGFNSLYISNKGTLYHVPQSAVGGLRPVFRIHEDVKIMSGDGLSEETAFSLTTKERKLLYFGRIYKSRRLRRL